MRRRRSSVTNNDDSSNSGDDSSSNDSSSNDNNYDLSSSTILTSRYGHESTQLIHVIEKNLLLIMAIIVAMAVLSILNTFGVLEYLYTHDVDYIVDLTLSIILVVVLAPLIILLLKSRRTLDRWADMFERNTIVTTMNIAMKNRSKEEAILALPQSVQQISEPLQEYIDSKRSDDMSEFLNVSVDSGLVFDVLLDANHLLNDGSADRISNNLKMVLKEYGAIVIDIIDGNVDRHSVEAFTDSLSQYNTMTNNQIGLGLIIGENVAEDARQYAIEISSHLRMRKRGINFLVVMAKPSSPVFQSPSQEPEQTPAV
jgi:hypothetical protein